MGFDDAYDSSPWRPFSTHTLGVRSSLLALVPLLALSGCDRTAPERQAEPVAEPTPGPTAEKDAAPKPEATEAPKKAEAPKARRDAPPKDLKMLAEGAAAPAMQDLTSTEGPWSRSNAPTIVAFYRGHW